METMTGKIEVVSPDDARIYIASSLGNRALRKVRVSKYATDMRENRWMLMPHGLCFCQDHLCDGHHRCAAVIEANVSVVMYVVRNVPRDALPYLDCGMPRNASDALRMAGQGEYTTALLSCARAFEVFPHEESRRQYQPPADLLPIIERHAEALDFGCSVLRQRSAGISRAARILLGRAWYTADRKRLEEFAACLISGVPQDPKDDIAAITYRNFLLTVPRANGMSSIECERYRKGQTALAAFLRREGKCKLYGTEVDMFPIPNCT